LLLDLVGESVRLSGSRRSTAMTYEKFVYAITSNVWRWEIWQGRRLLRCGTARTKAAAEMKARQAVTI